MSAEAVGWVFRHSPYAGATLNAHLAIADSVNDQNGNEFWMAQARLAKKARIGRRTAQTALENMLTDGCLELLEEGKAAGQPNRYRFLFPDLPLKYDSQERVRSHSAPSGGGGALSQRTGCVTTAHRVRHHSAQTQIEPKREPKKSLLLTEKRRV
jgi:hypothetical protein